MSALPTSAGKRGPTVLVTDSRDHRPNLQERTSNLVRRPTSRFITVDSVLQYASDIPSMQQRKPFTRPPTQRTEFGKPVAPKLAGRTVPQHIPARSTKLSEKLVLIPETSQTESELEEEADYDEDNETTPERDEEEHIRKMGTKKGKSYAERLPKARRAEKLARVTAYCTAQSYKLKGTAAFLKTQHGARTKLYDDCLYVVYHLPLLPGTHGYRIRSSPVLKNPGGSVILDDEIERNERRDYEEHFFSEEGHDGFRDREPDREGHDGHDGHDNEHKRHSRPDDNSSPPRDRTARRNSNSSVRSNSPSRIGPNAFTFAELYIFSYGVAVFWNFTAYQEKDVLADLTFFSASSPLANLILAPLPEDDVETEEFHFEYSDVIPRPRVYNDMITLRSGDHMIKLTMSHAIAQSTKLSYFEQQMSHQMADAQHVPRRLALTGKLGMKRDEVVRILGALFKSRVDVNLSSNLLATPSFFWSSEPTLHPLYHAVREYLEIKPRIQVLNERCRVFLDLAEILSDSIADAKMSHLTWIIIALILVSILVTGSEVFLRWGLLRVRGSGGGGVGMGVGMGMEGGCVPGEGWVWVGV